LLGTAAEHALISLRALNALRISEATGADIEALGTERGHRALAITRKAAKAAVIPLAPAHRPGDRPCHRRTLRVTHLHHPAGQRLDRHGAGRIVRRVARFRTRMAVLSVNRAYGGLRREAGG
jgi:integrase/recombinase XerD